MSSSRTSPPSFRQERVKTGWSCIMTSLQPCLQACPFLKSGNLHSPTLLLQSTPSLATVALLQSRECNQEDQTAARVWELSLSIFLCLHSSGV